MTLNNYVVNDYHSAPSPAPPPYYSFAMIKLYDLLMNAVSNDNLAVNITKKGNNYN